MKAVIATQYGSPDVLQIQEVETPTPQDNEIRVKIRATTVTSGDVRMRSFTVPPMFWLPGRLALGITRLRNPILGFVFAGDVDAVGKDVTRFKVGDAVLGSTFSVNFGAHAEYKCLPEDELVVTKPESITYEQAAAIPFGGLTALDFFRAGQLEEGQRVLVNGASGAVGTYAVQLAKHFGAHVTGVCSGKNFELVKSLGADALIDYTQQDFTRNGETYDIIFDAVGTTTFAQVKNSIKPNGAYLHAVMVLAEAKAPFYALTTGIKVVGGNPPTTRDGLIELRNLVEAGHITPVIDCCYPLEQIAEAHRYVDTKRKRGSVVITIGDET